MYIVAGLGNPGSRYETTRHNVGFMTLDRLARELGVAFRRAPMRGAPAMAARARRDGIDAVLLKPHTYMNLSGLAVRAAASYYGVGPESIIVVYDDLDLEVGRIRIRARGSSGGHRGMRSVIDEMGTEEIVRVRIGIGRPPPWEDSADYVLSSFVPEELPLMSDAITNAAKAILCIMAEGVEAAQTEFNRIR